MAVKNVKYDLAFNVLYISILMISLKDSVLLTTSGTFAAIQLNRKLEEKKKLNTLHLRTKRPAI